MPFGYSYCPFLWGRFFERSGLYPGESEWCVYAVDEVGVNGGWYPIA